MKYPIGTVLFAPMQKSTLKDDFVYAEIIGFKDDWYHIQLTYSHPERQKDTRKIKQTEVVIDSWMIGSPYGNWSFYTKPVKIQLDEELFTI